MNPHVWLLIGLESEWKSDEIDAGLYGAAQVDEAEKFAPASKKAPPKGGTCAQLTSELFRLANVAMT
jgi:hypothetical protein